ncbi:MAG: OmcA/MtrC family decaheme c-type cytochrome [Anaeromyxobacteraceae bacterium]
MNSHTRSALLALAAIVSVAGCSGKNGANGANGTDGTNGTNGVPGVSSVTADLAIKVVSVTTSSPIAVRFTLKDKRGYPVDVNGIYSVNTVIQPRFGLAYTSKDAAGNVLPYTVLTNSSSTTKPTLFQPTVFNPATAGQGTLVENGSGAGDYTYTFPTTSTTGGAQAVAYDATKLSATHVVWIQATRQTNLDFTDDPKGFSAANQEYDYVPAGGTPVKREVVLTANCSKCHDGFRPGNGSIAGSTFHGGGRVDAGFCNICHNPGRTSNPSADSKVFVHRLHGSAALQPANLFHGMSVTYPQDVRNCGTCHAGAAQGDQYKTNPSILACGSCHDYVSFSGAATATCTDPVTVDATGLAVPCNHIGGTQANDAACSGCHSAASITTKHAAVVPPDANNIFDVAAASGGNQRTNAAYIAAGGYVPPGAAVITNDVLSVSRNASKQPVIVFKFKKSVGGATATDVVFNTYAAGTTEELMTGFVGAPSVYFAFAVPQDGITAPADFNATVNGYLRSIWNGSATGAGAGTMTGPDATGYYTVTLTGVVVPDTATMLTGGIGYSYDLSSTQPLTQIDLPAYPTRAALNPAYATKLTGGLIVPVANVAKVATAGSTATDGKYTARRAIVDNAKCNACHAGLGVEPNFHVGQRNDGPTCSFCHTPNRTSSAWSANSKDFLHALHGAKVRYTPFTWHQVSATEGFWDVEFPSPVNRCEACHVAGAYFFTVAEESSLVPNLLPSTVGTGTYAAGSAHSPYITEGTAYGAGFSFTAATGAYVDAASTTLVVSPITAACSACHDSPLALAHMEGNGGSFYAPRSAAVPAMEQCLLCHGQGKTAAVDVVHQ